MPDADPSKLVAAGYDAIAERYAAWQAKIVDEPRERHVRTLLAQLPEQPDILEIGCGAGVEPTPTLARRGRLVGVDVSAAQIERARAAVRGARLIQGDITAQPFPAESFDAVVALYVLTHIRLAALPELLHRVAAWLRPGGWLLATLGASASHEDVVEDWLGAPMFFAGHDPRTNERLVRRAGLRIRESHLERIREPETEPAQGPRTVAFHWLLAQKGA